MVYLITHTDLDGVAPEVLARIQFKNQLVVLPTEAHEVDKSVNLVLENIKDEDILYIVDCAPSPEMMEYLNQSEFKKYLFDHHTPKFNVDSYDWAIINEDGMESGTSLFCKHLQFHNYFILDFVDLVRRWDTWEWVKGRNDLMPKHLNQLSLIMGREDFVNHCIRCLENDEIVFNEMTESLIYYKEKEINNYIKSKLEQVKLSNINGIPCAYVMAESYRSELANAIMNKFNINLAAVIASDGVSLRSRGDLDINDIAKEFGGGGRLNTGGYKIDSVIKDDYVKAVLNSKVSKIEIR